MTRFPTSTRVIDFKEVFSWICYDYEDGYPLNKIESGAFVMNKLYIDEEYLTYKTECYEMEPDCYEKVQKLYNLYNNVEED